MSAVEEAMGAIRCMWRRSMENHCANEGVWVLRMTELPCGHESDRGRTQYYCERHIAQRVERMFNETITCAEHEKGRCASQVARGALVSVERL